MNILALDFGTRTGWAARYINPEHDLTKFNPVYDSGVETFTISRGESAGVRFIKFSRWLNGMLDLCLFRPDLCVYEKAHHRGGFATDLLVGMVTRLEEQCAERKIEYVGVHSGTLKKWATGHGKASKDDMKSEAARRFANHLKAKGVMQWDFDDNEADALLLLGYAEEKYGASTNVDIRRRNKKEK